MKGRGTPEAEAVGTVLDLDVRRVRMLYGPSGRRCVLAVRVRFPGAVVTYRCRPATLRLWGLAEGRLSPSIRWTSASRDLEVHGILVARAQDPGRVVLHGLRVGVRGRPETSEPLYATDPYRAAEAGALWSMVKPVV